MQTQMDRDQLVSDNMKLAFFMAKQAQGLDPDEALSAAMDGLWNAAKEFDENRNIPFGSFAALQIRWKLCKLRDFYNAEKRNKHMEAFSLNAPINSDSNTTFEEITIDEKTSNTHKLGCGDDYKFLLNSVFDKLTPRQQEIISLYFGVYTEGNSLTLDEIAEKFKISRPRVKQIMNRAFFILKKQLSSLHYNIEF